MKWHPLPVGTLGIAIFPFRHTADKSASTSEGATTNSQLYNDKHFLPIEVGDIVHLMEYSSDSWARGFVVERINQHAQDPNNFADMQLDAVTVLKAGIFPANCIHVQSIESLIDETASDTNSEQSGSANPHRFSYRKHASFSSSVSTIKPTSAGVTRKIEDDTYEPMVHEISVVLRDWMHHLKHYFWVKDYELFQQTKDYVQSLLQGRKLLMAQNLSSDALGRIRRDMLVKMLIGTRIQSLEILPRLPKANPQVADESNCTIVSLQKLYKILSSKTQQVEEFYGSKLEELSQLNGDSDPAVKISDISEENVNVEKLPKLKMTSLYSIRENDLEKSGDNNLLEMSPLTPGVQYLNTLMELRVFAGAAASICGPNEYAEFTFSLYSWNGTDGKFLSEDCTLYSTSAGALLFPEHIIQEPHTQTGGQAAKKGRTVFTEIPMRDVESTSVFLICRIVRVGRMSGKDGDADVRSSVNQLQAHNVSPPGSRGQLNDNASVFEVDHGSHAALYRRPFGYGVMEMTDIYRGDVANFEKATENGALSDVKKPPLLTDPSERSLMQVTPTIDLGAASKILGIGPDSSSSRNQDGGKSGGSGEGPDSSGGKFKKLQERSNASTLKDFTMKVFASPNDTVFHNYYETIISKKLYLQTEYSSKTENLGIGIKTVIHADLYTAAREDPSLVGAVVTHRFGLPEIFLPSYARNTFYLTLMSADFSQSRKTSARSIECSVTVRSAKGETIPFCIMRDSNGGVLTSNHASSISVSPGKGTQAQMTFAGPGGYVLRSSSYESIIIHHSNNPHYSETIRISLPYEQLMVGKESAPHIWLNYRHISSSGSDKGEKFDCFSVLPLVLDDGTFIPHGQLTLPIFKQDKRLNLSPGIYLDQECATMKQIMTKDTVVVKTSTASVKILQNPELYRLIRWNSFSPENAIEGLRPLIKSINVMQEHDIMRCFYDLLDNLFALLDSQYNKNHELGLLVLMSLVHIVSISSDRRFKNLKLFLLDYQTTKFQSTTAHTHLLAALDHLLTNSENPAMAKDLRACVKVWNVIFKFVVQSRINEKKIMDGSRQQNPGTTKRKIGSLSDITKTSSVAKSQKPKEQQQSETEDDQIFKQEIIALFGFLNEMIAKTQPASIIASQTLILQHLAEIFPELSRIMPTTLLANKVVKFFGSMTENNQKLKVYKLQCILAIIKDGTLFDKSPQAREVLLPVIIEQVKETLVIPTQVKYTPQLKEEFSNALMIPLEMLESAQRFEDNQSVLKALSTLIPSLVESYVTILEEMRREADRREKMNRQKQQIQQLRSNGSIQNVSSMSNQGRSTPRGRMKSSFGSALDLDTAFSPFQELLPEIATCLLTTFRCFSDQEIMDYFLSLQRRETSSLVEFAANANKARVDEGNAANIIPPPPAIVEPFFIRLFQAFESIVIHDAYPVAWSTLSWFAARTILRVLIQVGKLLPKYYWCLDDDEEKQEEAKLTQEDKDVKLFRSHRLNLQFWKNFFFMVLSLMNSPQIQTELFPPWKQQLMLNRYGDSIRSLGKELVRISWRRLLPDSEAEKSPLLEPPQPWKRVTNHFTKFTNDLLPIVIETTMSPHPELQNVAVDMFFDIIYREALLNGSVRSLLATCIDTLDALILRGRASECYRKWFTQTLEAKVRSAPPIANLDKGLLLVPTNETAKTTPDSNSTGDDDNLLMALALAPDTATAPVEVSKQNNFGDMELDQSIESLIQLMDQFMGLLLQRRAIPDSEEYEDDSVTSTLQLMKFIKTLKRDHIYIKYVHQLADLHRKNQNWSEIAFTLKLHADLLPWALSAKSIAHSGLGGDGVLYQPGQDSLEPFLHFPRQTPFQRKEQLYTEMLSAFEDGKYWEEAISLCKELSFQYESRTYDYTKLALLLQRQSVMTQRLLAKPSDVKFYRVSPEYYRVAFYGNGFPISLRNKQYIYRGLEWEKIAAFCERIQNKHPGAEILRTNAAPADSIVNGPGQFIQVVKVDPIPDETSPLFRYYLIGSDSNSLLPKFDVPTGSLALFNEDPDTAISTGAPGSANLPEFITEYYEHNDIFRFSFTRPFMKFGKRNKGANEFLDLWTLKTELTTADKFPGLMRRLEVISFKVTEYSPIENALFAMRSKNYELLKLERKYRPLVVLAMAQNSALSAISNTAGPPSPGNSVVESRSSSAVPIANQPGSRSGKQPESISAAQHNSLGSVTNVDSASIVTPVQATNVFGYGAHIAAAAGINTNPLSMAVTGAVSAPVNGGVPLYRKTFLTPEYLAQYPDHQKRTEELQDEIDCQVIILDRCIQLQEVLAAKEMKPFHDECIRSFFQNFGDDIARLRAAGRMTTTIVDPSTQANTSVSIALNGGSISAHQQQQIALGSNGARPPSLLLQDNASIGDQQSVRPQSVMSSAGLAEASVRPQSTLPPPSFSSNFFAKAGTDKDKEKERKKKK